MQEPGEHPYCGDGIIPKTGFSYTPESLMHNRVEYYNMFWKDLSTPSHETTVKIVQLMHKTIIEGGPERRNKVLVHCHAGQGRTAIIIGAYLLYGGISNTAEEAVALSKKGRPKLFKNPYNAKYLVHFEEYLKEIRQLYPLKAHDMTLKHILKKQRIIL